MAKIFLTFALVIISLYPQTAYQANLTDTFRIGGFLDIVAGKTGYNTNERSIDPIIANIITVVISFLGVIFLFLMLYGGFTWMTAQGDDKKVAKAQAMLTAAIIGLIVVVAAYAITYFVFSRIASPNLEI